MRRVLILILVLIGLWSVWWWAGITAMERGMRTWLEAQRARGWAVDYALSTGGYPTDLTTVINDLRIADTSAGLLWQAPNVTVTARAWAPTAQHIIFPSTQTWETPERSWTLSSDRLEAHVELAPRPSLPLTHSTLSGTALTLTSGNAQNSLEALSWTTVPGAALNSHDLEAFARGITLSQPARARFDPRRMLPDTISELHLETTLSFDAPWDLNALAGRRPQPTKVEIKDLYAIWGGLELRVVGQFEVDAEGRPEGRLDVKAINWRDMIALMQANGTLPADLSPFLLAGLEALAGASGRADTLDAPLILSDGLIRFGPLPIGIAPTFTIR